MPSETVEAWSDDGYDGSLKPLGDITLVDESWRTRALSAEAKLADADIEYLDHQSSWTRTLEDLSAERVVLSKERDAALAKLGEAEKEIEYLYRERERLREKHHVENVSAVKVARSERDIFLDTMTTLARRGCEKVCSCGPNISRLHMCSPCLARAVLAEVEKKGKGK